MYISYLPTRGPLESEVRTTAPRDPPCPLEKTTGFEHKLIEDHQILDSNSRIIIRKTAMLHCPSTRRSIDGKSLRENPKPIDAGYLLAFGKLQKSHSSLDICTAASLSEIPGMLHPQPAVDSSWAHWQRLTLILLLSLLLLVLLLLLLCLLWLSSLVLLLIVLLVFVSLLLLWYDATGVNEFHTFLCCLQRSAILRATHEDSRF